MLICKLNIIFIHQFFFCMFEKQAFHLFMKTHGEDPFHLKDLPFTTELYGALFAAKNITVFKGRKKYPVRGGRFLHGVFFLGVGLNELAEVSVCGTTKAGKNRPEFFSFCTHHSYRN